MKLENLIFKKHLIRTGVEPCHLQYMPYLYLSVVPFR